MWRNYCIFPHRFSPEIQTCAGWMFHTVCPHTFCLWSSCRTHSRYCSWTMWTMGPNLNKIPIKIIMITCRYPPNSCCLTPLPPVAGLNCPPPLLGLSQQSSLGWKYAPNWRQLFEPHTRSPLHPRWPSLLPPSPGPSQSPSPSSQGFSGVQHLLPL